jgi:5'-nucleotidase
MDRKTFIKIAGAGMLALGSKAYGIGNSKNGFKKLVILHTNDWHSRIEPFPDDNSRNANLGGISRRAKLIEKIRKEEKNTLLVDAGDIFQGTPYFNYFGGELELKLMSELGYEAATIGNHEFDGGMDGLLKAMGSADFEFVSTNYDFSDTILEGKTKKSKIITKDGIKIGIVGAGIELRGLVPQSLYKETRYSDPVSACDHEAGRLKSEKKCDIVICLSHLGYRYNHDKVSDIVLANNSENIDVIIGGHTHTFMKEADIQKNIKGKDVIISQAGWAGINLGRIDLHFDRHRRFIWSNSQLV